MRNGVAEPIVGLVAMLVFSSVLVAQTAAGRGGQGAGAGRGGQSIQGAGPAPKRDLNGAWVGPGTLGGRAPGTPGGAGRGTRPFPPMTPLGESLSKLNKPEPVFRLAGTNDPFVNCDPLGFPRNVLNHAVISAGMRIAQLPDRMIMLYQYQRVWREIWTDGRALPKNVDAKGGPDSRFYGYSVGHWDGDYTFVIDTVGSDDRTWLDTAGHPHSVDAHFVERYTRVDQNTIKLTLTIDDSKIYTKPFDWIVDAAYTWIPTQEFEETFCVPSEGIEYRDSLARPAGSGEPTR